jgi:hypothetical protein
MQATQYLYPHANILSTLALISHCAAGIVLKLISYIVHSLGHDFFRYMFLCVAELSKSCAIDRRLCLIPVNTLNVVIGHNTVLSLVGHSADCAVVAVMRRIHLRLVSFNGSSFMAG